MVAAFTTGTGEAIEVQPLLAPAEGRPLSMASAMREQMLSSCQLLPAQVWQGRGWRWAIWQNGRLVLPGNGT